MGKNFVEKQVNVRLPEDMIAMLEQWTRIGIPQQRLVMAAIAVFFELDVENQRERLERVTDQYYDANPMPEEVAGMEGFCAREGSRVGRRWHALRGYAAMSAARRGATIIELMYQFGWTSFAMAQRYIDIAQAGRRA